jgi:hypothetical protein
MTNLSPSARQGATRRTAGWQRRTAGLCVAGAGAALMGLLVTPLARADTDGSSLLLAAASTDLPDGAAATAYHDLSNLYEFVTSFENSYGSLEDLFFFSDLTILGNVLSATGLDLGDPFPSGATASDDVSAIVGEDTTLTDQLTDLEQEVDSIEDGDSAGALTANQEADVVSVLWLSKSRSTTTLAIFQRLQPKTRPIRRSFPT